MPVCTIKMIDYRNQLQILFYRHVREAAATSSVDFVRVQTDVSDVFSKIIAKHFEWVSDITVNGMNCE